MFDISVFAIAAVAGVPLLFVVLGLVEWIKGVGLKDPVWIRVASMLVGLLFGGGYMIAEAGVPDAFAGWFALVVYGIGLGLVASGIYDVGGALLEKVGK